MSYKFSTENLILNDNRNHDDDDDNDDMMIINRKKNFFLIIYKMNYYQFNRQEILQKAKERYSKEKAAEYYLQNKEAIKEKARGRYKNLSQEEKDRIKEYQKKRCQKSVQYKK